jgi:hypothetical protein
MLQGKVLNDFAQRALRFKWAMAQTQPPLKTPDF